MVRGVDSVHTRNEVVLVVEKVAMSAPGSQILGKQGGITL